MPPRCGTCASSTTIWTCSDPKRVRRKSRHLCSASSFDGLTAREVAISGGRSLRRIRTPTSRRSAGRARRRWRRRGGRGLPVIVLCGRPYHLDAEINHGIDELIRSMGAVVISEDALGGLLHRAEATGVLNQWTYHAAAVRGGRIRLRAQRRAAHRPGAARLASAAASTPSRPTRCARILEAHGQNLHPDQDRRDHQSRRGQNPAAQSVLPRWTTPVKEAGRSSRDTSNRVEFTTEMKTRLHHPRAEHGADPLRTAAERVHQLRLQDGAIDRTTAARSWTRG